MWRWEGEGHPFIDINKIDSGRRVAFSPETESHPITLVLLAKMSALLKGRIAATKSELAPRCFRRRSKKEGGRMDTPVNVVTLVRRYASGGHGEIGIVRDKHWLVQGHVRMQPYPSKGLVWPIYIKPYLKGNLKMPMSHKPTVKMVSRSSLS